MGEMVDRDIEHLRIIEWGYYVTAGFTAFFSLFSLIYVVLGGVMLSGALPDTRGSDPRIPGAIILGLGLLFLFLGLTAALLAVFTGRFLRRRTHPIFCTVVAVLCCFHIPWGTILGIWTIITLGKPGVKALFAGQPAQP